MMRKPRTMLAVALLAGSLPIAAGSPAAALPSGFQVTTVISGLSTPTSVRFSSDGRIFVAEKHGYIKVYEGLSDTTPTVFADLTTNVYSQMDRGLLGIELHPNFPATPYLYAVYTYDAPIGGTAPRWGTPGVPSDPCPDPPGAITNGCVASARLSRLQASGDVMTGTEHVLINDWCSQFPSHSIGTVTFGPDGMLYVGGGDGAKSNDWGQFGDPVNPCGDPPGGSMAPPTAEGGSLRAQDLRTLTDPVGLDGTIIRVDPETGLGPNDNPMASSSDVNARRVIAYGVRNPFRFAFRPGTTEIWIADVGENRSEEIDVIPNATDAVMENFGWPCYEANPRNASIDNRDFDICEQLYANPGAARPTFFEYAHDAPVYAGDPCRTGGGVISAINFYDQGSYPEQYNGALFFGDYARNCIWVMRRGQNGQIDPNTVEAFHTSAGFPVDIQRGPGGDLFYVDVIGRLRRITYFSANQPPVSQFTANPTFGPAPLSVNFDGSASSDPEGGALSYSWDLDGDGTYGDAVGAQTSYTYTSSGSYAARLRVTDPEGSSSTTSTIISVGNTPPVATIISPAADFTWHVGETISLSGSATDAEEGQLPASASSWEVILHHCPSTCHTHPVQSFSGQWTASLPASDHEYPSHLEVVLTVTDSYGLTDTRSVLLQPETSTISLGSTPSGLSLGLNSETAITPFTRTVVTGSTNALTAPSPQTLGGAAYAFGSWSDGGARTHDIVATSAPTTYTATFTLDSNVPASLQDGGYDPRDLVIALGQTVTWTNLGVANHTVTDNSGMGLFDSGPVAPGGSWARAWHASGRYPTRSTTDPTTYRGSVSVPISVSPTSGTSITGFQVSWASAPHPAGYVSDIDIQRPGSTAWVPWRANQVVTGATFVPDAGVGTYSFRARFRSTTNGRSTAYTLPRSIEVTAGNLSPSAVIATDRTSGSTPLTVQFDGAGSSDPEGGALSYSWDLDGDGVYGDATTPQASYTYTTSGDRTARLRVTDPEGAQGLASVLISAGNVPPAATIVSPAEGALWRVGQEIAFSGSGSDPEDGAVPASAMLWEIILHHCPTTCHTHPVANLAGQAQGTTTAPDHAHPSSLEIMLTVTDSNGQSASASRWLEAETTTVTLDTSPTGLTLELGGEPAVTPFTRTVIVGSSTSLNAPSPQSLSGTPYTFVSWSDGGAQSHQMVAGTSPVSVSATYQVSSLTEAFLTDGGYNPGNLHLSLGQSARWTNTGSTNHTVTDNSGMGLFDSGLIAPNGSYSRAFTAAGRYPIRSTVDSAYSGSVWVPMMVAPPSGSVSTSFGVTWATVNAPLGYVYDVQIQRPGSPGWVSWRHHQTSPESSFAPDAGGGTYSFRSRVRSTSNGRSTAYTDPFAVFVS